MVGHARQLHPHHQQLLPQRLPLGIRLQRVGEDAVEDEVDGGEVRQLETFDVFRRQAEVGGDAGGRQFGQQPRIIRRIARDDADVGVDPFVPAAGGGEEVEG